MSRTILVPDTNFFLQCTYPAEINWADIGVGDEVTLMVCRAVLREIDDFKGGGNARRSRRARDLASRFRQMVTDREPAVLRDANPRVVLAFTPRQLPGFVAPQALDLNKSDDRIVAEAIATFQALGEEGALLTDDTGVILTAEEVQLAYIATPESWRMPPEKDERDKEINELRAQVTRLSRSAPQLTIAVSSNGEGLTGPLVVPRFHYPPLSPEVTEELTRALVERYPLKTDFSREADNRIAMAEAMKIANGRTVAGSLASHMVGHLGSEEWKPPSDGSIDDYRDAYEKWLIDVRRYFAELHTALPGRSGQVPLSFSLENLSCVPADHVLVDIVTVGGLLLAQRPKKDAPSAPALALPAVPEAPGWQAIISGSLGSALRAMQGAMGRQDPFAHQNLGHFMPPFTQHADDPHAFYWRDGPPHRWLTVWGFRCVEFRHQAEAEPFHPLVIAPADDAVTKGAVRFRASARNLPDPIECTVAVRVEVTTGDTESAARALMPAPLSKLRFKGRTAGE